MQQRSMLTKVILAVLLAAPMASPATAKADGCYACGPGSSGACGGFCRYSGNDSFAARKQCESKGCRVTGTAACPPSGAVCKAPAARPSDAASMPTQIAWCAAEKGRGST